MKISKLYVFFLVGLLSLTYCDSKKKNDPEPISEVQKVAKKWKVGKVFVNGQEDKSGAFSTFRITFNAQDKKATTYTVVVGNASGKPNLTPNNQGVWSLIADNTKIALDANTTHATTLVIAEKIAENKLVISWKVPKSIDKAQPHYKLELIPA